MVWLPTPLSFDRNPVCKSCFMPCALGADISMMMKTVTMIMTMTTGMTMLGMTTVMTMMIKQQSMEKQPMTDGST